MQYSAGKSLMQLDANFVSKHPRRSRKPIAAPPNLLWRVSFSITKSPLPSSFIYIFWDWTAIWQYFHYMHLHLHEHATPQSTVFPLSLTICCGTNLPVLQDTVFRPNANSHSPVSTLHCTTPVVWWTDLGRVVLSQITHHRFVPKGSNVVLNDRLFFCFHHSFFFFNG